MGRIDILPKFTVKIEGGSGCLFQPVDENYSYVLTARHVISDNKSPKIVRQTLTENGDLVNDQIEIIGQPFYHTDEHKDAAIIKVKKVEDIEALIRADLESEDKKHYYLCGHPKARADDSYSFRQNGLSIENTKQYGYIEAELSKPANHSEVVGQSGGGVIKIEDSCFLLAGIQKKMAVPDAQETLGRVEFMPISFFDEIIDQNKAELSLLFPPYIKSFERLLNEIFLLPNMLGKKELVQNELKAIAKLLCVDFSPNSIIEIFKDTLLIDGTDKAMINHKQLWVSFLELLCVNQLHQENKLTFDELKDIHKKRKLFFADTDEWTKKLEDIYKTDLSEVEKDGCVVISTTGDTKPTTVEIDKNFIGNIAIIPQSEMTISNTVIDPIKDLRIVHIYKFQSHIITNAMAFAAITVNNTNEKLRDETRGIL